MTCPREPELTRALTTGADPELAAHLAAHLAGCDACRATWDATRAAIELARELPVTLPSPARREEMRTAVLAAAARVTHRPARRAWLAPWIAGAAAAAGVIGYVASSRGAAPGAPVRHPHGVVRPQAGARYLAGAAGADELVWLTDGAIDVEVEPLPPGERFRVLIGGAEVEVRGTAFTVTARAAHLTGVTVARGRVDVRPETGAAIVLGAGQAWHPAVDPTGEDPRPAGRAVGVPTPRDPTGEDPRPAGRAVGVPTPRDPASPIATAAPVPAPLAVERVPVPVIPPAPHRPVGSAVPSRVAVPRAAAAAPHDAPAPPSPSPAPALADGAPRAPEELSYDRAWEALRANQFAQAAGGFARVLLLAPDSPLVEDASFWHAVALARGKRSAEALSAFRDFLDTYGRSARAGEASTMLGWILVDARDYDEAGRRFRAAVGDGNPAVARSARAGLDALAAHAADAAHAAHAAPRR